MNGFKIITRDPHQTKWQNFMTKIYNYKYTYKNMKYNYLKIARSGNWFSIESQSRRPARRWSDLQQFGFPTPASDDVHESMHADQILYQRWRICLMMQQLCQHCWRICSMVGKLHFIVPMINEECKSKSKVVLLPSV